jgi:hypothetical protein
MRLHAHTAVRGVLGSGWSVFQLKGASKVAAQTATTIMRVLDAVSVSVFGRDFNRYRDNTDFLDP